MDVSKWIKNIDISKELRLDDYCHVALFHKVADIVPDTELTSAGKKKRGTVIQFKYLDKHEWEERCEWIYIFSMDGVIVKIGGTRTGLKGRAGSYLCGHHVPERNKSGDCSKTNGFIYNTFDHYLSLGRTIEMHAFKIPRVTVSLDILGRNIDVDAQVHHAYESRFLQEYKNQTSHFPCLSDNADPNYK